jgi:hypothetical protein
VEFKARSWFLLRNYTTKVHQRPHLVRKIMVESALLATIGGVLGIGVAYAGTKLIISGVPDWCPNNYVPVEVTSSGPVLLFAHFYFVF